MKNDPTWENLPKDFIHSFEAPLAKWQEELIHMARPQISKLQDRRNRFKAKKAFIKWLRKSPEITRTLHALNNWRSVDPLRIKSFAKEVKKTVKKAKKAPFVSFDEAAGLSDMEKLRGRSFPELLPAGDSVSPQEWNTLFKREPPELPWTNALWEPGDLKLEEK